jgi:hypothetical protein
VGITPECEKGIVLKWNALLLESIIFVGLNKKKCYLKLPKR